MNIMELLKKKLENAADSYPEFVESGLFYCEHFKDKNNKIAEQLLEFIEKNPTANASDILEHEWYLMGLPYCNDDGIWRRWDTVITKEEAQRIAQSEYCED